MQIQNAEVDRTLARDKRSYGIQDARVKAAPEADEYSDVLSKLVQYFEQAEDVTREARQLSERDRDYYDNDQWTAEELAILRARKQPALTINYVARKVETMRGYERRTRSDPKAYPRTPNDESGANAATDALRFVGDQNDFDTIRSDVYENLLVEGTGGCDVVVEEQPNGERKVTINYVPWDRIFYDPHARARDFRDATYKGIVLWMDEAEAVSKWGDAAREVVTETFRASGTTGTYADRPGSGVAWCDSKRTRVRIVQIHYQWRGTWMLATFTKGGFLEEPTESPYRDKYGQPAPSLVLRSAYVDRQNNRYGAVRSMISLQDEINRRRSKALHLLSVRQTFGNNSAISDVQKARTELAKPDGHVELIGGSEFGKDFGVLPTGDLAQGQIALLDQAVREMQATGPNNALAGKGNQSQSGRAWEAQQQAGAIEQEPLIDELRQWTRDVYEAAWLRVRQFWTEQVWVRVTDDERNVKFIGLNRQVTLKDKLEQIATTSGPDEAKALMQQMGILSPWDPKLQQVVETENKVSDLDVDITITEGPDVTTLQSEQFQNLTDLAKAGMAIPPKAIIMASSLRNKDQILDEMEKGGMPPELQKQMAEMQQQMQQLTQENQQLKADKELEAQKLALENRKLDMEAAPDTELPSKAADTQLKLAQAEKTKAETIAKQLENAATAAQLEGIGVAPTVDEAGRPMPTQAERYAKAAFESVQGLVEHITAPTEILYAEDGVTPIGTRKGNQVKQLVFDEQGQVKGIQ